MAKYEEWLRPENLILIEGWARDGLTIEDIAYNIGITPRMLYIWKNKYSEIEEVIKKGGEVPDRRVENALFKRALGYTYTETKRVVSEKDGVRVETTIKEVPPDTTACIFWLKNRKSEVWNDRKLVEGSVAMGDDGFIDALLGAQRKLNEENIDELIET